MEALFSSAAKDPTTFIDALRRIDNRSLSLILTSGLLAVIFSTAYAAAEPTQFRFSILAQGLTSALDRFSEQSGLQVVYDQSSLQNKQAPTVTGLMRAGEALDYLLAGSALSWNYVDDHTVVVLARESDSARQDMNPSWRRRPRPSNTRVSDDIAQLEMYVAEAKGDDPVGVLPLESVDSVFGFGKKLGEIPRSVSVLGEDLMKFYGIEAATDVARVAPGTYTASIFGINGNVNVRGMNGDTYFRGVKRLENTQLFPSPITAMSRLDIVRGPPSPLYGPGKVGGYTNFVPKSARASTGKYLRAPSGQIQLTAGSYDKKAASAEVGGPFSLRGKPGGYYAYVNAEDSDTYWDNVPFKQYIVQSSFDYEPTDAIRLEFGQMYQFWGGTELAGWNRITQELIDTGTYNAGEMSVNMDRDGDGLISTAEVDAYGALLLTFPAGSTAADVAAALGENWNIDPQSARTTKLSRRATAQTSEDDGEANVHLAYFDIVFRIPDGSTLVSKSYFETMDRFKWTRASAFGQDTHASVMEQKLLYEKALLPSSSRLRLNLGVSGMFRHYDAFNRTGSKYNDLVNRADLSQPFSASNRFAVPNLEPDLAPWNTGLHSIYNTVGFGSLLDATFEKTNLVLGVRFDWVDIDSRIPDYVLTTPGLRAKGEDEGPSWSVSASHELMKGVRPYATYARQQTLIYGIDGGVGIAIVPNAFNTTELREAGIKASLFGDKLFAAIDAYRQTRRSFSGETTQVPSTMSRGWEVEVRWAPSRRFSLTAGGNWQKTTYVPLRPATTIVNPTFFGLPDGYYGGRLQVVLPGDPKFATRSGYPDRTFNLNGTCFVTRNIALNISATSQSDVPSGRVMDVTLPSALILGAAVVYDTQHFTVRVAANNLSNELYFIPNSPDITGEVIAIPAPERHYQTSVTFKF